MPFNLAQFEQQLLLDNPTFERILRSDLHDLVVLLRKGGFSAMQAATEMNKIPPAKWMKYARSKTYLRREIPMLADMVPEGPIPVRFTTTLMQSEMADTILRHQFKWESDTGSLADLSTVVIRENVTWGQWPQALTNCIGDAHAAYTHPGHHVGLATNHGNIGGGQDDHSLLGPFNQTILSYTGPAQSASMNQVYEYSFNSVRWLPIAGSEYTIVREVAPQPGNRVKLSLTKTSKTKPSDHFSIERFFPD
jgi:hypothetical protein